LDGWLGELGRKNLLLLAASPAKPAELWDFVDFGEFGDWKPKTENWKLKFVSLFPSRQQLPKKDFFFKKKEKKIFFKNKFRVRADAWSRPRGRGFYRVNGW
jgi:hypothetical protein